MPELPLIYRNKYRERITMNSRLIQMDSLDMLESEGYLYHRIHDKELGFQYYLYNDTGYSRIDKKKDKIKDGIWKV